MLYSMQNYIDKFGQYHARPTEGDPPTNDGFIVSAYAKKAGLVVDLHQLKDLFSQLARTNGLPLERLPGKSHPYLSRDVILGLYYLGIIDEEWIKDKHRWSFSPHPIPKFNILKSLQELGECRNQHRNYFWENELSHIYRFAFAVPVTDRFVMMRRPSLFIKMVGLINKHLMKPKSNSSKLIHWLKYDKVPELRVFEEYFGHDHPITLKMKETIS